MKRLKSPNYLDFIRGLPCICCGDDVHVEAAHIRYGEPRAAKRPTGMGEKPDDRWAVPLCGECHREQHKMWELEYWQDVACIDPVYVALALQINWGDREACERIIQAWCE